MSSEKPGNGENPNQCEVCRQPTERKCTGCKLVYYCNIDHEKENWKNHKNKCFPFEVAQSLEMGQYLRATRNLAPGDKIFVDAPLLIGLNPQYVKKTSDFFCVACYRLINPASFEQCPICSWPVCSVNCPGLKDLNRHGLECKILKLKVIHNQNFRFDVLIILRALLLQKTDKNKWELLLKIDDHLDKRGPDTDIFKIVEEKIKFLEDYLKQSKPFLDSSRDLIHKIQAILDIKALECAKKHLIALYPLASNLEPSCNPNSVSQIIPGNRIVFRTALPIQEGEHITITYTNLLLGTYVRRRFLKKSKYFSCCCNRCKDPTELGTFISALKCFGSEAEPCGGIQLPVKPTEDKIKWICNKCKIKLPNRDVMKFVDHLGSEMEKLLIDQQTTLGQIDELLQKLLHFLHPNHYYVMKLKLALIKMFGIQKEDAEEKIVARIEMCQDLIGVMKIIDPGNTSLFHYLGLLLHELFTAKFILLLRKCNRENKNLFEAEINEIGDILKENKQILQFDTGSKLFVANLEDGRKYRKWLEELG